MTCWFHSAGDNEHFKLRVPKKAEHLLGFPPAAAPDGCCWGSVAEAAEPFGRVLGRNEALAGTPPPSKEKDETMALSCSAIFYS